MARASMAENLEKMLQVQASLGQGLTVSRACAAAGVSSGSLKRWQEKYRDLPMPRAVAPLSERGAFLLSPGGEALFLLDEDERQLTLRRIDTASGAETAHHVHEAPRGAGEYRMVAAAAASAGGERVVFLLSDGGLLSWDLATGAVVACAHDLRESGCPLRLRSSSGQRRWTYAAISPDLGHVAYWLPDAQERDQKHLCVMRIADGALLLRYAVSDVSIPSAILFHPQRPWLAVSDRNKLLIVIDFLAGTALLEGGPQHHALAFSSDDTLLFDDWYGTTQEFRLQDGARRTLGPGSNVHASQGRRYLTANNTEVSLRDKEAPQQKRVVSLDRIEECHLSLDGRWLAVRADRICLWDVDALWHPAQAPNTP